MTNPYQQNQPMQPMPPMDLQAQQMAFQRAQMQYEDHKKNPTIAWLLWLFTGGIGGHRYYLGNTGYAIGMTLTLGGLGLWTLIDAFLINGELRKQNDKIRREVFAMHGIPSMA